MVPAGGMSFPVASFQRLRAIAASAVCGFAVHGDHGVVKRRVGLVARRASRIVGPVLGGVPALAGEIQPADEGKPIVDDDDLLMVRPGERVGVVEPEVDAPVRLPAEAVDRRQLAVGGVQHRIVPVEHVDVQALPAPDERIQEIAHPLGARIAVVEAERGLTVEVPGEHDDRALGAFRRIDERLEVVFRVDQERDTMRAGDGAAVRADFEDRFAVPAWRSRRGRRLPCNGHRGFGCARHPSKAASSRSPRRARRASRATAGFPTPRGRSDGSARGPLRTPRPGAAQTPRHRR